MIPRIGSALVAPSPFALPPLQSACRRSILRPSLALQVASARAASTSTSTSSVKSASTPPLPPSQKRAIPSAKKPATPPHKDLSETPTKSVTKDVARQPTKDIAEQPAKDLAEPPAKDLAPTANIGERANPPVSTLPAPVDVPDRQPGQSLFSYGLKSGKAYLQFYKTGVKHVWHNWKQANAVKARLRGSAPIAIKRDMDVRHAPFTRGEFQLLRRSQYDIRRVPPFVVLFLIIGEWLPVVAAFVTALVPVTCRIPAQIEKEERKREDQRRRGKDLLLAQAARAGLSAGGADAWKTSRLDTLSMNLDKAGKDLSYHPKKSMHLYLHYASTNFNVRSSLWDRTGAYVIMPAIPWMIKLRRYLRYLTLDDALLVRDGGVDALRMDEVRIACSDRGINTLGRTDEALKRDLASWLQKKRGAEWLSLFFFTKDSKK
ncbi:putative letm1-like protein [Neofusicoccum parvum UCRNP2]|uniref:Putative letm1-like protein n=1 Tax=Botryosphaeria parva (strain UCR-NP2) TaxID=1287680 RepID=R1GB59_BOTPV|nr:putative letm1-like protein [Neofusicoccum parvum UCRNP2]